MIDVFYLFHVLRVLVIFHVLPILPTYSMFSHPGWQDGTICTALQGGMPWNQSVSKLSVEFHV